MSHYLFIDGGALRGRLRNLSERYFGGVTFNVEFSVLKHNFPKAFYYDAIPVRRNGENESDYSARIEPNVAVRNAAASVDGMHVYEGDTRQRRGRGGLEQKQVDVMLTVDMLTHTFRRNMDATTLLTGDVDFKPLIDALVQNGMYVTLWYPPGETSLELQRAADTRRPLTLRTLRGYLTPESQTLFQIPSMGHTNPATPVGDILRTWEFDGKKHVLGKDNDTYAVTREYDELNKWLVRHSNYELLREFCQEEGIMGLEETI